MTKIPDKILKNRAFIWGSATVVVGTIAYILINRYTKSREIDNIYEVLETGGGLPPKVKREDLPDAKFPLKIGSVGKQVWDIQQALNKKYDAQLTVDGRMGQSTLNSLCKNVFKACLPLDIQARQYTVDNNDYSIIMNDPQPKIYR
jgi:hypothetical protein